MVVMGVASRLQTLLLRLVATFRFSASFCVTDYDIALNGTGQRSASRHGQSSRSHVQVLSSIT